MSSHLFNCGNELVGNCFKLADFETKSVADIETVFNVSFLFLGEHEVFSSRHSDGLHCVGDKLVQALLAEIWNENTDVPDDLTVRSLPFLHLGADPELLVHSDVKQEHAIFSEH